MNKKLKLLKEYREILLLCKRIQIINYIDKEIENKIPSFTIQKSDKKQKVLTLFQNQR